MATVRPPHLAPPRPSPPPVAAPPRPPYSRCRTAADVDRGRKESVAESWCCPTEVVVPDTAAIDDSDDDDDGCGSCVDGTSQDSAGLQELEEEASDVAFWRSQETTSSRRRFLWPPNTSRPTTVAYRGYVHAGDDCSDDDGDSDPEVAAARRQEEDRKFWEACLASGYP